MREKCYAILVNRHTGIRQRYHRMHDRRGGKLWAVLSWVWLLWLNLAYYVLRCRRLGEPMDCPAYEEKTLPLPESVMREEPETFARRLSACDVVSFDLFDTLIYRPFSEPADLFYLVGIELGCMGFKRIRMEAEQRAREKKLRDEGTAEVTLTEIWTETERLTGIPAQRGMEAELRCEMQMCYANPYMLEVWRCLRRMGTKMIYASDMYLPGEFLLRVLEKCGYEREELFLSCERRCSKADGGLFELIKREMATAHIAHVGDNERSDVRMARRWGLTAFPVENPNRWSLLYRAYDMSPIIGGAYRGLVNNRFHNGSQSYNQDYEYGYAYGGLFLVGYCGFIHRYCQTHGIDRILFLARDGEIIRKVYGELYPREKTEYAYLSRYAAAKLTAGTQMAEYLRKLVYHKVGQGLLLREILRQMELEPLEKEMAEETALDPGTKLTPGNAETFVDFLRGKRERILEIYEPQRRAAESYYRTLLEGCKRAAVVDIGWAGSGAAALMSLTKEWGLDCGITGILAGTNTVHNDEPDMSDGFLQTGQMVSYLYSSMENRDLWKKHDPAAGYNLYWELLLSSDKPSFQGFYLREGTGEPELRFQSPEPNGEGIRRIREGIMDFVADWREHFGTLPYMFRISGRDAYAPMLLAASHDGRYLRALYRPYDLRMAVGKAVGKVEKES